MSLRHVGSFQPLCERLRSKMKPTSCSFPFPDSCSDVHVVLCPNEGRRRQRSLPRRQTAACCPVRETLQQVNGCLLIQKVTSLLVQRRGGRGEEQGSRGAGEQEEFTPPPVDLPDPTDASRGGSSWTLPKSRLITSEKQIIKLMCYLNLV